MSGFPILSIMLAVPAIAAIACLFLSANGARWLALIATLIDLALGIMLWAQFDVGGAQWQFVESHEHLFGPFGWSLVILPDNDEAGREHAQEFPCLGGRVA